MNLFVADPEWGWWIILYFFLGGLAAGAYFVSALIELIGNESDRVLARVGYRIAFPLVAVCGMLLTVDLGRPERFWHMLLQSEVVDEAMSVGWPLSASGWLLLLQSPMLKPWSPMSIGAWALFLFGGFSFVSFLGSLWPNGWLDRLLHRRWIGHTFQLAGCGVGFFVASYTGALLTASNQPLWAQSEWIAPLFLTSAASTGIAALLLIGYRSKPTEAAERLVRADLWAVGLEACVFAIFLVSLGGSLPAVWHVWQGKTLLFGVPLLGLLLPLVLHLGRGRAARWRMPAAAMSALLGGFLLRYAIVMTPPALLAQGPGRAPETVQAAPSLFPISPEDGRPRAGGPGASARNRADTIQPRSKVFGGPNP